MYKDEDGLLKAGPVWDFDLQTFKAGHYTGSFPIKKALYYKRLFEDTVFEQKVVNRWKMNKHSFNNLEQWIDQHARRFYPSQILNFDKWPFGSTFNGDRDMEYFEAIEAMK